MIIVFRHLISQGVGISNLCVNVINVAGNGCDGGSYNGAYSSFWNWGVNLVDLYFGETMLISLSNIGFTNIGAY